MSKSSGQVRVGSGGGNSTGCANTRSTLWTYVNCRIESQKLTGQTYTTIELEVGEYFRGRAFDADGSKKRGRLLRCSSCYLWQIDGYSVSGTLQLGEVNCKQAVKSDRLFLKKNVNVCGKSVLDICSIL